MAAIRRRQSPARPPLAEPSFRRAGLAIGIAALLVRLAYAVSLFGDLSFEGLQLNAERYDVWARMILAGQAPSAPFEQSPGYAYFLSFLFALFGEGPRIVAIFQACLDAATCMLLACIAHKLAGRTAGIATGVLSVLCSPLIYFSAEVLPATIFVFWLAAAMATLTVPQTARWATAGCCLALGYLFRGETLLGIPVAVTYAAVVAGRRAVIAILAPWCSIAALLPVINFAAGPPYVVSTTSGGVNLWLGNNIHADGVNPFFGPDQQAMDQAVRSQAQSAAEASAHFTDAALQFWREQPLAGLALATKKLIWTFNARELPNDVDIEAKRSTSFVYALPALPIGFAPLLVLAALGLCLSSLARRREGLVLLLPAVIAIGTCVIFFTNSRFRLPLLLPMLVCAGIGCAALFERTRQGTMAFQQLWQLLPALAAGLLTWGNWYGVHTYRIAQIDVNRGIHEREAGNFDAAVANLRRGLEQEPRDAIAWVHLALALEQAGDVAGARQAYADGRMQTSSAGDLQEMQARFQQRWP